MQTDSEKVRRLFNRFISKPITLENIEKLRKAYRKIPNAKSYLVPLANRSMALRLYLQSIAPLLCPDLMKERTEPRTWACDNCGATLVVEYGHECACTGHHTIDPGI
jgi:hypothetical protein